ncbi:hypothetical protein PN447_02305, partial [Anabaena sp. CS-542/02]|nr:hypothetical protein [Anabaena sp. CS-542/02]
MKRFNLFAATFVWGYCLTSSICADFVLAGPVPVGSLSGVTLPGGPTAPSAVTPNVPLTTPAAVTPNVPPTTPVTVTPNIPPTTPAAVNTNNRMTTIQVGQTTAAQVGIGRGVT